MFSKFLSLLLSSFFFLDSVSSTEFIFNSFNSTSLLLSGDATVQNSLLSLTNEATFSVGRALYPSKIPTRSPNSTHLLPFSSSFIFSIPPYKNRLPGHGFAFLFAPAAGIDGVSSAQHLGLFNFSNDGNPTNHVFAIEFDVFENQEFSDIDDNHVGVDVNSLTSVTSHGAGYWTEDDDDEDFKELKLNNGENYQVWIEYTDSRINVTMERAGRKRPDRPLISSVVNLSDVLLGEMYVGFCGATGQLVEGHVILSWSFSHSNFSIGDALETSNLPSFVLPNGSVLKSKEFALGIILGSLFLLVGFGVLLYIALARRRKKTAMMAEEIQDWEMEYWPHRIPYKEIYRATDGFSDTNFISSGANGKIYKGVMTDGSEIAVKSIPHENEQGMKTFLSEISTLGRLKHRNLVGLRGWSKKEKGILILVYEYMENGSLDKRIFQQYPERIMLNWKERIRILKEISHGILYLHEGWEAKVLHRDIKASNVLLDKNMTARLGDFGLAQMARNHKADLSNTTTRVVGTLGYMAPELVRTGRATVQTDVYGFGVLVLEVVCGREPIMADKAGLVDWVWGLMQRGELVSALDERVKGRGGYREEEVERVLQIGLLCAHPEARRRMGMRQVVKALEVEREEGGEEGMEMEVSLLRSSVWSERYRHPTFDDVQMGLLSSIFLPVSDIILEGR